MHNSVIELDSGIDDICFGSYDPKSTKNYTISSLVAAFPGMSIRPFVITRWLEDGEIIHLEHDDPLAFLHIFHLPGHSMDSIAIAFPLDRRIFVGDIIYPYLGVHVELMGSNVALFRNSVTRLNNLVNFLENKYPLDTINGDCTSNQDSAESSCSSQNQQSKDLINADPNNTTAPQSECHSLTNASQQNKSSPQSNSISPEKNAILENFCSFIGLEPIIAQSTFNVYSLLNMHDWDIQGATMTYFSCQDSISEVFPPQPKASIPTPTTHNSTQAAFDALDPKSSETQSGWRLSCGHVNPNLDSGSTKTLLLLLDEIDKGKVKPMMFNDEFCYTEYAAHGFHLILSNKPSASSVPTGFCCHSVHICSTSTPNSDCIDHPISSSNLDPKSNTDSEDNISVHMSKLSES